MEIKTTRIGGRYQHRVREIGVKADRAGELSNWVVEGLKEVNEKLYEEMPEGSGSLVSRIEYNSPKKR